MTKNLAKLYSESTLISFVLIEEIIFTMCSDGIFLVKMELEVSSWQPTKMILNEVLSEAMVLTHFLYIRYFFKNKNRQAPVKMKY